MENTARFFGVPLDEPGDTAPSSEILEVFETLRPKASTARLIRIGEDADGSYLVPDLLEGITACFSPGVNGVKQFEDYLCDQYAIRSHMCDFTCDVDDFATPLREGWQTFDKQWLDPSPGADNVSLEDWVRRYDRGGDLLLQMDIEGAEYRNLLATADETLSRFRVVVLEFHGLGRMLETPALRAAIAPAFAKLGRAFTTVHAHPNNCCGDVQVPGTDVRVPNVLELTLLRHDWFEPAPGPPLLPHPLDVGRNVRRNAPLFLSEAWSGGERPLESRLKMLEERVRFSEEMSQPRIEGDLEHALSLTMRSLDTVGRRRPGRVRDGEVVEVAAGRPYRSSSARRGSTRTGAVRSDGDYFFHTRDARDQSIRIDLGRRRRIRRIEITNRRDAHQDRARFLFVVLSVDGSDETSVFPVPATAEPGGGAWDECAVDLPDPRARYVTIVSPLRTALHLADVRVYAVAPRSVRAQPGGEDSDRPPTIARRLRRAVRARRPGRRRTPSS